MRSSEKDVSYQVNGEICVLHFLNENEKKKKKKLLNGGLPDWLSECL